MSFGVGGEYRRSRVLLVEDDAVIRGALIAALQAEGHFVISVPTAAEAFDAISYVPLDLILSDIVLPNGTGFDVAAYARQTRPRVPVVLMSSFIAEDMVTGSQSLGVRRFLRKPFRLAELLATVADLTEASGPPMRGADRDARSRLRVAFRTIRSLLRLLEMRDRYTLQHSRRVRRMSVAVGASLGLPAGALQEIGAAGWVHDVGKITVPLAVLNKEGRLTAGELALIRTHALAGAHILTGLGLPPEIISIVRHHHERFDGDTGGRYPGYPDSLAGEKIPLGARIIAVVDVFDAMTTARPYRPALSRNLALEEIERNAGSQFDPAVARCFLDFITRRLTGLTTP